MTKTFCDGCSKECTEFRKFAVPYHIAEDRKGHGFVDRDGNPTSGRSVDFELCIGCHNLVASAAFAALKSIKIEVIKA